MKISYYSSRDEACKSPYGAVPAGQDVRFSIYPARHVGVIDARLWVQRDGEEAVAYPMKWSGYDGATDLYSVIYTPAEPGLYWYYFTVKSKAGERCISRGYGGEGVPDSVLHSPFQLTVYDGSYQIARWFGEGITYNIFPDRFARTAVPSREGWRSERVIHENWEDTPVFAPNEHGEIVNNDFFGGSIRGVIEKLDYLQSLAVRTLYFNPMFEAFSNHRYDTGDYKCIDPMFGSEEDFKLLCEEAGKRGMRVVLDGVFSHTGYDSRYFNARGNYDGLGAYQSKESPYYEWFNFSEWPDRYSSWWGIYTLPETNEMNEKYLDYIVESEDSVIRRWLRLGASGWRLDVADELPDEFIERIAAAARLEKPDALIVGEVWEDASNKVSYSRRRRYFQGGELDSVMNYPLRDGILAFLGGDGAENFAEKMECLRENYPRDVFYNLMNIIGTHDTARAITVLGSSQELWNADKSVQAGALLEGGAYEYAKRRLKMAAVIQFGMPGSPTIYYGDEAGLQGYGDPLNRRTYPWGHEDTELLDFYRALCLEREENEVLREGDLQFLTAEGGHLVFARSLGGRQVIIAVNRDDQEYHFRIPQIYAVDVLTGNPYWEELGKGAYIDMQPESVLLLRCGGDLGE